MAITYNVACGAVAAVARCISDANVLRTIGFSTVVYGNLYSCFPHIIPATLTDGSPEDINISLVYNIYIAAYALFSYNIIIRKPIACVCECVADSPFHLNMNMYVAVAMAVYCVLPIRNARLLLPSCPYHKSHINNTVSPGFYTHIYFVFCFLLISVNVDAHSLYNKKLMKNDVAGKLLNYTIL